MTMEDLENKFNSLAGERFKAKSLKAMKEAIFNCEDMSAAEFMSQMVATSQV